jgi:nicotinamide phosphoribosyltransferase
MYKINSLLLKDFYKATHLSMIPANMTKSVSYYTPRKSRINRWPKVVNFGLQMFIKNWLIDEFNENFFKQSKNKVVAEYKRVMEYSMGVGICDLSKVEKLHDLGYLPIEIIALPEGMLVPMGCPIFGITNTHDDFAWLPQALESLISAEVWYPMITATVGYEYRKIVNRYYNFTCDDNAPRRRALGNFDFRGDMGVDAALKASAGWLLSFVNTATVPSIPFMEKMYNCDITNDEVGFGAVSTEHFVMCSNSAKDIMDNPDETYQYKDIDPMRERVFLKKLLTELYPNTSFSCVCDSYDYWNVVKNILPTLKDEILNHNGCMLIRGDSGDCVKVVTETVFELWKIFGGTINSKGYKVLDPHVKAIYGDSITVERAEKIYEVLKANGFAAQNVALGVGSFSMHCIEENGILKPFTRDTFSSAIKAVYAEFKNEDNSITKLSIFKDPKTDRENGGDNMKKSHKGCCRVFWKNKLNGDIAYEDNLTYDESLENSLMTPIFRDGKFVDGAEVSLNDIRKYLNHNMF